jgi:hypothetical protein
MKISPTCVRRKPQNMLETSGSLLDSTKYHIQKYKESTHMSLVDHPVSQPSLDISPLWTPIITAEVRKLKRSPV